MIKKLTLISVVVVLCLFHNQGSCQNIEISPFQIGQRIPDLPVKNIINYKDSVVSLSSFGDKLLILHFWNLHCTSCIYMFPLEDSIQAMFPDDVQFILITSDKKEQVTQFLTKYNNTQNNAFSLPLITTDSALSKLFRFTYIPHYVWLAPNGLILAESSDYFINKENIVNTLMLIREEEARLQGKRYADFNLHMQKPTKELLQLFLSPDN